MLLLIYAFRLCTGAEGSSFMALQVSGEGATSSLAFSRQQIMATLHRQINSFCMT